MKQKHSGLDTLIKALEEGQKHPKMAIRRGDVLKARKAAKLGGSIRRIAKAMNISYPTVWRAVKAVPPYDQVK